jgi:hypothetical protein
MRPILHEGAKGARNRVGTKLELRRNRDGIELPIAHENSVLEIGIDFSSGIYMFAIFLSKCFT